MTTVIPADVDAPSSMQPEREHLPIPGKAVYRTWRLEATLWWVALA